MGGKVIVGLGDGELVLFGLKAFVGRLALLAAIDPVLDIGGVVGYADVAGGDVIGHSPV